MVAQSSGRASLDTAGAEGAHVLIIEAPYYADVAAALVRNAIAALEAAGATWERVAVAGALEIPQALTQAVAAGLAPRKPGAWGFDAVVAIGCVIRGETSHYDIVCTSANHWLMEVATKHAIPVGNAILTVDTERQALARADGSKENKGRDAALACLALVALGRRLKARTQGQTS